MLAVLDTNFIVRYLTGSRDIGNESRKIFEDSKTFLIIPSIVLVELKYLSSKGRVPELLFLNARKLLEAGNCMIYPLDQAIIDYIPTNLNIHDGIIYATAKVQRKNFDEIIYLLTKDSEIKKISDEYVKVIW